MEGFSPPVVARHRLSLVNRKSDLLLDIGKTPIRTGTKVQVVRRVQKEFTRYRKPGGDLLGELLAQPLRGGARENTDGCCAHPAHVRYT